MKEIIKFLNENQGALMVIITAVYVIATILICKANIKSAKASNAQIAQQDCISRATFAKEIYMSLYSNLCLRDFFYKMSGAIILKQHKLAM